MKKFKKIICLVIAFLMTMSLIAVSVGATAPTTAYPTYAEAEDGDLLYAANFNGDDVLTNPKNQWAGMNSSNVSADGNSVTVKGKITTSGQKEGQSSAWGTGLVGFDIVGKSYTVVLTVDTGDDTNEEVGFLFCDYAGFIVNPGQNSYNFVSTNGGPHDDDVYLETDGNGAKKNATYDGNGETKQSYAIQWKVSGTVDEPVVESYNLYAAKDGNWLSVCSFTTDDLTDVVFDWASEAENDFEFRILHNCYLDDQGSAVTVNNVKVYKGLVNDKNLIPVIPDETPDETPDTPPADSTLYDAANEGDVLYTANFNGDSYWTPSAENASQNAGWGDGIWPCDNITVTPDTTDSSKATIKLSEAGNAVWGDDIEGLPLGADYKYTIKFTVVSTNGSKEGIGIFPDGQTGGYFWSTKARIQQGGGKDFVTDYVRFPGNRTAQDYAIEVDGYSIAIYAKLGDVWALIDSVEDYYYDTEANEATFFNDNLCLYFYAYNKIDITVGDVEVYKGVSVLANKGEIPTDETDDSGNDGGDSSSTPKPENKAPVLVENETEAESEIIEEKKGCGSSIGLGGVALLVASVAGISKVSFRRKEDE